MSIHGSYRKRSPVVSAQEINQWNAYEVAEWLIRKVFPGEIAISSPTNPDGINERRVSIREGRDVRELRPGFVIFKTENDTFDIMPADEFLETYELR